MSLEIQRKPADAWEATFSAFSTVPILDPILEKPLFRFFNRGLKTRYLRGSQERKAVEETDEEMGSTGTDRHTHCVSP